MARWPEFGAASRPFGPPNARSQLLKRRLAGMANARHAKRSPGELDALAVKTARLTYEQDLDAEVVAMQLGLRGKRDVNALLQRAKGLVAVTVAPVDRVLPQDYELAEQLKNALDLRHAFVVSVPAPGVADDQDPDEAWKASRSLHEALGRVAGEFLLMIVRSGDKIGVCAGRGVGYTVEHISKNLKRDANAPRPSELNGQVYSLGGGSFLEAYTRGERLNLYIADYNAHGLASALGSQRFLCAARAYRPTQSSRDVTIKEDARHLADEELVLDIALYGAAVVDRDHYVLRMSDDDPQVGAISDERDELMRITADTPTAVLDHCERFYAASDVPKELQGAVEDVVTGLNHRVVSAHPELVSRARERILVGGGAEKLAALLELTQPSWRNGLGPTPTALITDSETAKAMLGRSSVHAL